METPTEKPEQSESKAQEIIARYDRLKSKRESFYDPAVRSAMEWINPRKSGLINAQKTPGEAGWVDNLFDMTASVANERLAAWLMTNTSPANSRWFAFTSSPRVRSRLGESVPAVDQWWQTATQITLEQLAGSSFYTDKHEALLDRNTAGTCAVGVFPGVSRTLSFRAIGWSTYVVASNADGYIDTLCREFKLTVRQMVQQFGEAALGEQAREKWNKPSGKDDEFTIIHAVFPNMDRKDGYEDVANKAFTSCYVCREDKGILQEGGFDEFPFGVSRFLKWVGEDYGWAPAFTALPTIRETNFVKMQMNALFELMAFPPTVEPDTMLGVIDLRAGGRNIVTEDMLVRNAVPKALRETSGNPSHGQFLLDQNREFIEKCFYGDVIAMFSNLEREVTAFEASQLLSEKLDVFSPYYHRLINELDTPLLQRTFAILLNEGHFPPPPAELIEAIGPNEGFIDLPEVTYLSRLALAIQAHEVASFDALLQRAQLLASIDPALAAQFISNYDLDRAARGLGRNIGVPVDWQKAPAELEAEREAQAQAAQAQALAEAAPKMAKAAKDVDSMSASGKNRLAQAGIN